MLSELREQVSGACFSGRLPAPCPRASVHMRHGHPRPLLLAPVLALRPARRVVSASSALLTPPARELELEPSYVLERLKEQQQEALMPMPSATEGVADDVMLQNPLQRLERLSTGWFGVVMEYEGVLVPDTYDAHVQAWLQVADEKGYSRPRGEEMRRIKGVRDDVVVTRIFLWTRNPATAKQIADRKMELYDALRATGPATAVLPSCQNFLETMCRYSIPVALASALPGARLSASLDAMQMRRYFNGVVSGEDSGAPEVEYYYTYAAQLIQRPPARCVVVGQSNVTVEAAHELGMKVIIVAGNQPVYHFSNADLVVRSLDQVSFINMKQLFANEDLVPSRLEANAEEDEEARGRRSAGGSSDGFVGASAFGWSGDDSYDDEDDDDSDVQGPPSGGVGRW